LTRVAPYPVKLAGAARTRLDDAAGEGLVAVAVSLTDAGARDPVAVTTEVG
jgi:hypothetical protein